MHARRVEFIQFYIPYFPNIIVVCCETILFDFVIEHTNLKYHSSNFIILYTDILNR